MNHARRALIAALVPCAMLAVSPSAAGAAALQGDARLSPDLAKLARPSVRSLSHGAQANVLDLPASGPGSLVREGARVLVNVRFEAGAIARIGALKRAGGEVVAASRRYQTVSVAVLPADLRALARVPGVGSVIASLEPLVHAAGSCEGGSVVSEGVEQLELPAAREAFGLRGAEITVGVLSDSYDTAETEAFGPDPIATKADDDTELNDLPGPAATCSGQQLPVQVLDEAPAGEGADEGRAMLQIVHDIAPHAELAFATAFPTEISFAENIERLAKPASEGGAGADVIVDDVAYFEEPFFQDGPVANAVAKVAAEGVLYLTAAGNENLFQTGAEQVEGEPGIASWEAPQFRDAASCPAPVQEGLLSSGITPQCMNFDSGGGEDSGFGFTVRPKSEVIVDLQWAEPWNGVEADLDAYLVADGQVVAGKEEDNVSYTERPVEWFRWRNTKSSSQEVQLVINRCSGEVCNKETNPAAKPRLKFILMGRVRESEYPVSSGEDVVGPTVYGHAASASAITLGAVPAPVYAIDAPEEYSSRGPAVHYFGPVAGTTAAANLLTPETLEKPDVVATDCGATTFFAGFEAGAWRFCGTSAAAPHAAGIAALMVQGAPAATREQVAASLEASGRPVGAFGSEAIGAGLIDAKAALEDIGAAPTASDGPSTEVPPVIQYETEKEKEPPVTPPTDPPVTPPTNPPITPPTIPPVTPPSQPSQQSQQPTGEPPAPVQEETIPATRIRTHPRKVVRTRRALARVVFRFAARPRAVAFRCQFDGSRWRRCGARVVRWFGLGPHVVRVQARGGDGALDPSPAVFRFRVARVVRAAHASHRALRR